MPNPTNPLFNFPYIPPIDPYRLPPAAFNAVINANAIRLYWLKGHTCPCMYAGPIPGSPDNQCLTCQGRGIYWDQPFGPWNGLITFIHTSPTPDEPGTKMDEEQGAFVNGEPTLTIPSTASGVYAGAAVYDLFVEVDAINRFNVQLRSGYNTSVPYQQSVTIAPTGAVTIYDTINHVVVTGVPYTVSGVSVQLSSGYANGTNFVLEYSAAPAYVAWRQAGIPAHIRPFGQLLEPRRFRLQSLDYWTRSRSAGDIPHV